MPGFHYLHTTIFFAENSKIQTNARKSHRPLAHAFIRLTSAAESNIELPSNKILSQNNISLSLLTSARERKQRKQRGEYPKQNKKHENRLVFMCLYAFCYKNQRRSEIIDGKSQSKSSRENFSVL